MNDSVLVKQCCLRIEEKLDWGEAQKWTNKDFYRLSEEINNVTHILISPQTLKRLFGKTKLYKTEYNPQDETKRALAVYLGYQDWDDFRIQIKSSVVPRQEVEKSEPKQPKPMKQTKRALYLSLTVVILVLLIAFYATRAVSPSKKSHSIEFKAKDNKGLAPYTAFFTYDISNIQDTVFIHFGAEYKVIELPKDKKSISNFYLTPGYYHVRVYTKKETLATAGVHILSEGWRGLVYKHDDFYYNVQRLVTNNGKLFLSKTEVGKYPISGDEYFVGFSNIKDFNVDGNDFILEAKVKNSDDTGGKVCYDIHLEVLCENYDFKLKSVMPGCHRYCELEIGDHKLNGFTDNLSFLAIDASKWQVIALKCKNNKAEIYVDSTLVYSETISETFGSLKGIGFKFKGSGMVENVKLYGADQRLEFEEEFN